MSKFAQEMAFYSAYHQEPTNVWIHVLGVPLITLSAFAPLAMVELARIQGMPLTMATLVLAGSLLYYLRLDRAMGLIAVAVYGSLCWLAHEIAALGWGPVLTVFAVGQIVGWGAQIWGHLHFERNRPAFFESLFHSLVSAPLFVIADVLFHLGFKRDLQQEVAQILVDKGQYREFDPRQSSAA